MLRGAGDSLSFSVAFYFELPFSFFVISQSCLFSIFYVCYFANFKNNGTYVSIFEMSDSRIHKINIFENAYIFS